MKIFGLSKGLLLAALLPMVQHVAAAPAPPQPSPPPPPGLPIDQGVLWLMGVALFFGISKLYRYLPQKNR